MPSRAIFHVADSFGSGSNREQNSLSNCDCADGPLKHRSPSSTAFAFGVVSMLWCSTTSSMYSTGPVGHAFSSRRSAKYSSKAVSSGMTHCLGMFWEMTAATDESGDDGEGTAQMELFQFSPLLPERAAAAKRSENTRRRMIEPARTPRAFHFLCTSSKEVAAAAAFWLNQDKPGCDVLLSAGSLLAKLHYDCKQFMAAQWAIMLH